MIKKVPHGFINFSKTTDGFQTAAHHSMGWGKSPLKPLKSTKLLDSHMYSPKPGKVVDYTFSHTEINPYKAGGIAVGGAAVGYGVYKGVQTAKDPAKRAQFAKSAKNTNRTVGRFYANHPTATRNIHAALGVGNAVDYAFFNTTRGILGMSGNIGTEIYGRLQAEQVTGKPWAKIEAEHRKYGAYRPRY